MIEVMGHSAVIAVFSMNEAAKLNSPAWLEEMETQLRDTARDVIFMQGCYKGQIERSYAVTLGQFGELRKMAAFHAAIACEETVLILGPHAGGGYRSASLARPDTLETVAELGLFGKTDEATAKTLDAWTMYLGDYFVCLTDPEWRKLRQLKADGIEPASFDTDWRHAETVWMTPALAKAVQWAALEAAADRIENPGDKPETDAAMAEMYGLVASRFGEIVKTFEK